MVSLCLLQCIHEPDMGFRRGSYHCTCSPGFYFHREFPRRNEFKHVYNGSDIERSYLHKLLNQSQAYDTSYKCLPCAKGCKHNCTDDSACQAEYDILMRGIPLGLQSFCMTISIVLGVVIVRLRKSKVKLKITIFLKRNWACKVLLEDQTWWNKGQIENFCPCFYQIWSSKGTFHAQLLFLKLLLNITLYFYIFIE